MKKILFCAGVLALAASCTEEFDTASMQQQQAKGITFTATQAPAATTRGQFVDVNGDGTSFVPFWSADTNEDKIQVFSTLTTGGTANTTSNSASDWVTNASTLTGATYKATKSQRRGDFTGINDNNILDFATGVNANNPSQFVAVYPASLTKSSIATANGVTTFTFGTTLPELGTQAQAGTNGEGVFKNQIMYSGSIGYPTKGDEGQNMNGVGENLGLEFHHLLSGLVMRTKGLTKEYADLFGNLTKITVTTDGEYEQKDGEWVKKGTGGAAATKFVYNTSSTMTVALTPVMTAGVLTGVEVEGKLNPQFTDATASTVTLTVGQKWSDDARAYMVVAPVERKFVEGIKVIYDFANIKFTETAIANQNKTNTGWVAGTIHRMPALDIDSYDYLLVKNGGSNYALIVNHNGLAAALNESNKVEWDTDGDGTMDEVDPTNITTLIVNGDLNDADWKALQLFTAVTKLTLSDETEVPAKGLAAQGIATITDLSMPKVTKIAGDFTNNVAFKVLANLNLASYNFPEDAINKLFFNGDTDGSLATLDMSAVTNMKPEYAAYRTLSFQDYTALKTVKMNETKVIVSQNAFNGCANLESVTGTLDLSQASYAFQNAGSTVGGTTKFTTVNVCSTVIPPYAFNGATHIENVLMNKTQVVPTKIGAFAFSGTAVEYMDLSKATTIGNNAMMGSKYAGVTKDNNKVEINVETVEDGILAGTNITYVRFNNAELVKGNFLWGATRITQVKFVKAFTVSKEKTTAWEQTFGANSANVDLFINPQQLYQGNDEMTLELPYYNAQGKEAGKTTFTFNQITRE